MDDSKEHLEWLRKFETKKTTDDCLTPALVYDAVRDWVTEEYGLRGRKIVRPFYPGGNYQQEKYKQGCVVIDNPPFSIFTEIVRFYESNGIEYFIFAPGLSIFTAQPTTSIIVGTSLTYDNGANVSTAFATNLPDASAVRSAPDLREAIRKANRDSRKEPLPRYVYPDELITSATLNKLAGVPWQIEKGEVTGRIDRLDCMREKRKDVFGYGRLVGKRAATMLKKLKSMLGYSEPMGLGVIEWTLSDREKEIVDKLSE